MTTTRKPHTHIAELNGYSIECTPVEDLPNGMSLVRKRVRTLTHVGTKTLRPKRDENDTPTHY